MEKPSTSNQSSNLNSDQNKLPAGSSTRDSLAEDATPPPEKVTGAMKKTTQKSNMKFMENFDPERSNREKKKMIRKFSSDGKKTPSVYDENGILYSSGLDLCDCMIFECEGCHYPCPRCQSRKCGHECRVNRKWSYESVELQGSKCVLKPDRRMFNRH